MFIFMRKAARRIFHGFLNLCHSIASRCKIFWTFLKVRLSLNFKSAKDVVPPKPLQDVYPDRGGLSEVIPYEITTPRCFVSIIIPMYNAAEFIIPCLESVLQQRTHYSYEVILVDDGSTDNTVELIKPYLVHKEFRLIQQENHGQSYARNRAIEQSAGQCLFMLDADDLLLSGAIETMCLEAEKQNADIVECGRIRFHDELKSEELPTDYKVSIYSAAVDSSFIITSTGFSTGMLFHRDLWQSLRFPEGYIFEDVITKFILRRKARKVAKLDIAFYGYRMNRTSSSHQALNLKHLDSVWVFPKIVDLCQNEKVPFDAVFYLLALNHITVLNAITVGRMPTDIAMAGFCEMQKQLKQIVPYRSRKIPRTFRILEKAVLRGNFSAWKSAADTVVSHRMLSKWREIN